MLRAPQALHRLALRACRGGGGLACVGKGLILEEDPQITSIGYGLEA